MESIFSRTSALRVTACCSLRAVAVAVTCTAASVPGSSEAAAPAGSKPYKGSTFDVYLINTERPGDLIIYDGQERVSRYDDDGVSVSNRTWLDGEGPLVVEGQRRGFDIVQAGIGLGDLGLVDEGLKAIEWALQPAVLGPDNSFPEERETDTAPAHALHPRSEFVESAGHTVVLIRQSDIVPFAMKMRAEALVPAIRSAAQSFVDSGDAATFFEKVQNASQLAFVATAIFEAGYIANDAAMMEIGNGYMQQILDMQWPDGVFPEQGGYDTSYQLNTTVLITIYTSLLPRKSKFRRTLLAANNLGIDWFLSRVGPDGTVDTTGNSRTQYCGDTMPGPGPKGPGIDKTAIRLLSQAYLAGTVTRIGPIADQIQYLGQEFDHEGDCPVP